MESEMSKETTLSNERKRIGKKAPEDIYHKKRGKTDHNAAGNDKEQDVVPGPLFNYGSPIRIRTL